MSDNEQWWQDLQRELQAIGEELDREESIAETVVLLLNQLMSFGSCRATTCDGIVSISTDFASISYDPDAGERGEWYLVKDGTPDRNWGRDEGR